MTKASTVDADKHVRLILSWIDEAERKVKEAEAKQVDATYLRGRVDGYKDCLALINR